MRKSFPIYILLGILLSSISISCNSDSTTNSTVLSSNTAVTSFSLQKDDSVLTNLDSVFFSIDLDKAEIYNADSLPKGTDISKILVKMSYATASSAQFHVTNGTVMKDSTFTYSEKDSVDFTGKVTFTIVSQDLTEKRVYTVKINVHKMDPDSLYWNQTLRRDLPTTVGNPIAQKTVQYKSNTYCLTQTGLSSYVMASASAPDSRDWNKQVVNFSFVPQLNSLTATSDALYILDTDGRLYSSVDGATWTDCAKTLYSIVGSYNSKLLGVVKDGSVFKHFEYPVVSGFESTEVEEGFPIMGGSSMITINTEWSVTPQNILVGGVDSNGKTVGSTWGYDGTNWGKVSLREFPAHQGMIVFAYYNFTVSTTNWSVSKYPILVATGGKLADGTLDKTVYTSKDQGVSWSKAGDLLQLPDYIPAFMNAQAFVCSSTLTVSRSSSEWTSLPAQKIPAWYVVEGAYSSRVTAPINSWECPYIYLFGGTNGSGELYNNVWKGAINRLTFRPLY